MSQRLSRVNWPQSVLASAVTGLLLLVGGCSWVGSWFDDDAPTKSTDTSVFDIQPGQCFNPPADVKAEIATLAQIGCDQPHVQEAYLVATYEAAAGSSDTYPGSSALTTFADGTCAQAYGSYVGVSYVDSTLWFTYLLPTALSWEQNSDRRVICFVTTTGEKLTASVAGSKR